MTKYIYFKLLNVFILSYFMTYSNRMRILKKSKEREQILLKLSNYLNFKKKMNQKLSVKVSKI